jgi:hypothetical protein
MTEFMAIERAIPFRQPAVSNLMIDSVDSTYGVSAFDFLINKPNSLLNGYFTRIGATEVVLDWNEPNVITGDNDTVVIDISGGAQNITATLPQGAYTVAGVLDALVSLFGASLPGGAVTQVGSTVYISSTSFWRLDITTMGNQLFLGAGPVLISTYSKTHQVRFNADLRTVRYLDFISSQLTNNQNVKDTSTDVYDRNVLCRWYMDWDDAPTFDKYGFPILMGYTAFGCRRLFSPAKQIRWEPNQPIGQLAFQVYPNEGFFSGGQPYSSPVVNIPGGLVTTKWMMTLQISEA